jgi:DNA replication protein DnaC
MIETIKPKLVRLKLTGMMNGLETRLREAQKEKWSYSELLDILLSDEIGRRNDKKLQMRLIRSKLDPIKTFESFDFYFNTTISHPLIKELASCEFVKTHENIFLIGPSGIGKSHLAQAIGHEAIRKGHDVLFYRVHQLSQWVAAGKGDGTHQKRLAQIIAIPLLILDDFGLQTVPIAQQEDFYEIICGRYENAATVITSNRSFDEWFSVFANPLLASAALDRLIHRATKIEIKGKSYRMEEFRRKSQKAANKEGKHK